MIKRGKYRYEFETNINVFLFPGLFFSCDPDKVRISNQYMKAFFLGENSFYLNGEVFSKELPFLTKPFNFTEITVKAHNVDGWEISGNKISESKFELTVSVEANNKIISKETIEAQNVDYFNRFFPAGFPYCELRFYINGNRKFPRCNIQFASSNGYFSYAYIYVAEPIDLTETIEETGKNVWGFETLYISHYDLNFSRVGWYKVVDSYNQIKNDPKYSTGENTFFEY